MEGTISALTDWQQSCRLAPTVAISADRLVKQTLGQDFRCRGGVILTVLIVSRDELALLLDVLRLLLSWAQSQAAVEPANRSERIQDACWLVFSFFGMLRQGESAAL